MELDFTDRGENVSFPGANKETNNSNVAERSALCVGVMMT
jgi:hypothetical protein